MMSQVAESEGPIARTYNSVLGGFGEKKKGRKKKEGWQQILAHVSIFEKKKKNTRNRRPSEPLHTFKCL